VLSPGEQLGRYAVEEVLGHGGFGVVVKAYDPLLKERVALKVLHERLSKDEVAVERLRREVLLARKIDHPNVCRIHDLQAEGAVLFVVMEWVDGRTLADLIEEAALPPIEAVSVLVDVCHALAAAHDVGVLHRDIKPALISKGRCCSTSASRPRPASIG
jgi:serine/threonine protein kinase